MATAAQLRANAKYRAAYTKNMTIQLNLKTEADIIARLDEVGNKQGYIKALIRADIEKQKGEA